MVAKKHLVIVGKYYPPEYGGIEKYTADFAQIAARKYRVTVVVHNTTPDDSIEYNGDVTIIRCGTKRIISAQPISPSMWLHLWRLDPDLIHFNAPNFWASAILCVLHRKCPLIITHHTDVFGRPLLKRLVLPLYRHLVRRSTHLIVNSGKNAMISPDIPKNVRSILEIPWGIDESGYNPPTDMDQIAAERISRFGNAIVVGFVGRFVRYKGLSVLLKALAKMNNTQAILIGDGPLRPQVEDQIKAEGLGDRVHLLGNVSDARKIKEMSLMDVLAFPSLETTEAFGATQVEAQLLQIPVVASNLPTGVTDVTVDDLTGILVQPGNPTALADALTKIGSDPVLARRYGKAGRARALERFTLRMFEKRVADLLDSCMDQLPARAANSMGEQATNHCLE